MRLNLKKKKKKSWNETRLNFKLSALRVKLDLWVKTKKTAYKHKWRKCPSISEQIQEPSVRFISFGFGYETGGKFHPRKNQNHTTHLLQNQIKSKSEVWRRKRCPAAGATEAAKSGASIMETWEPGRFGRDTTRYSSLVTP